VLKFLAASKLRNKYRSLCVALRNEEIEVYGSVVRRSHRYVHEYSVGVDLELRLDNLTPRHQADNAWKSRIEDQYSEVQEAIQERVRELSRELYRSLEREHDFLTSDEALLENAEANEYEFDEYGNSL
jgi:siderophore synthetase component